MADRDFIRNTLIELLEADTGQSFTDLDEGKDLRADLGLDSVDVVSIVSQVERKFRIRLSHQELEKLARVGDVIDLLVVKLSEPRHDEKPALSVVGDDPVENADGPATAETQAA